ncbi:hypothetical protein TSUD_367200 [Trifolium subterraneum]|uniref:Uncharacterized protein n=1 Tax=Trifolium subterraneum TaxID=3900 RepID=A0A2Z6NJI9_TRISU|nr:hypothetical protein TSUD_367200 [Trifolium subterraneum]
MHILIKVTLKGLLHSEATVMPREVVVMTPCNSPTVNKENGALHAGGLGEKTHRWSCSKIPIN